MFIIGKSFIMELIDCLYIQFIFISLSILSEKRYYWLTKCMYIYCRLTCLNILINCKNILGFLLTIARLIIWYSIYMQLLKILINVSSVIYFLFADFIVASVGENSRQRSKDQKWLIRIAICQIVVCINVPPQRRIVEMFLVQRYNGICELLCEAIKQISEVINFKHNVKTDITRVIISFNCIRGVNSWSRRLID